MTFQVFESIFKYIVKLKLMEKNQKYILDHKSLNMSIIILHIIQITKIYIQNNMMTKFSLSSSARASSNTIFIGNKSAFKRNRSPG